MDTFDNTSTDSYEEYVERMRSILQEIIMAIPTEAGRIMYERAMDVEKIIRETGIDILTNSEKKQLINIAKMLLRRYTVENMSLKFNKEQTENLQKALEFLYNLPV
jgi:hypothetical protein